MQIQKGSNENEMINKSTLDQNLQNFITLTKQIRFIFKFHSGNISYSFIILSSFFPSFISKSFDHRSRFKTLTFPTFDPIDLSSPFLFFLSSILHLINSYKIAINFKNLVLLQLSHQITLALISCLKKINQVQTQIFLLQKN